MQRCKQCKKKLGLMPFSCSCGEAFCIQCRLPEAHACPVKVVKEVVLPKVVAPKVDPI